MSRRRRATAAVVLTAALLPLAAACSDGPRGPSNGTTSAGEGGTVDRYDGNSGE